MIHQTLKKCFGFDKFKTGQEEVIRRVINGDSAGAIFPTGSGKSLCYQLSALHLPALTLVVSPLLALMKDQLDFLSSKGIAAATIDSSLKSETVREIMDKVKAGAYKILLIAVERFKNERFRKFLSGVPISLMVVDEAHCISEWGHNFRPDYLKLPVYQREFNVRQVLLLTATATPEVIDDMCAKFNMPRDAVTVTGFYRGNLRLWVKPAAAADKPDLLYKLLKDSPEQASIVYVTLQQTAEDVALFLLGKNINAVAYHAGMEDEERKKIQNSFMRGEKNCIVATIAFGMGIDKRDIRRVIHYNLPKSIENYSQEIGRAGRDGLNSDCYVLANRDDVNVLENFIYGDTPETDGIRSVLEEIPRDGARWELRITRLSTFSNIRILPLKTLLVYLEMKGIVKPLYSYFAQYRYSNIISDGDIASKFKGERRQFIDSLFSGVEKSRIWTTVDIDKIKYGYNTNRDRITAALEYFHQHGFIKLEAKDTVEIYEVIMPEFDIDLTTRDLALLFKQKEQTEIRRIEKMLRFFNGSSCLSYALADYFGEKINRKKCDHCSICLEGQVSIEKSIPLKPFTEYDFNELTDPLTAKLKTPPGPELLTRFLCGITVPVFSKIKAKQLPGFGKLEKYRYADVRSWLEAFLTV
ncbi:MAG: recombinase RecQ [Lentisphaerae bacterium GWF2_44_16]|nr:MAG: recombinase RecQ [Lentisphaerae bacterium GWF2_44_16]